MGTTIAILGFVAFVAGIVLLFRKGRRKIGAYALLGGFLVFIVGAAIGGGEIQDDKAKTAGFDTAAEHKAAMAAGFSDSASYRAAQAELKSKEQAAAKAAAEAEQRKKADAESACRTDLQCWGDKNLGAATGPCSRVVERMAKNSHQWKDEWYETKFSRFRWANANKTVITFVGDRIQYQNGFGAWINHIYECDFDPAQKMVVDARARPGRLPE